MLTAAPQPAEQVRVELKQLELILLVVKEGGFGAAARRAGLSQPTLSKVVAKLEADLGVPLFERDSGSARPTPYGEFLVDRAREVLAMVAGTEREIRQWASGDSGKLRIGVGPATRLRPLPQLMALLATTHPQLRLEIGQMSGPALAKGVASGRFDLAFSYAGNAAGFGDLLRIKIFDDDMIVVARPDHALWQRERLDPATILDYPLASTGLTPMFHAWAGPLRGVQQRNAEGFITDDFGLIPGLLVRSDFVSHGPAFLFAEAVRGGLLRAAMIEWPERFECWMLTTPAHWRSPLVRRIAELARDATAPAS